MMPHSQKAVLDVMADAGIRADSPDGWSADLPALRAKSLRNSDGVIPWPRS
jgi:hypothetical protein